MRRVTVTIKRTQVTTVEAPDDFVLGIETLTPEMVAAIDAHSEDDSETEEYIVEWANPADAARWHLPAHPTAKHTWLVEDDDGFDQLPMFADGELGEPSGAPRHRAA